MTYGKVAFEAEAEWRQQTFGMPPMITADDGEIVPVTWEMLDDETREMYEHIGTRVCLRTSQM